MTAGKTIQSFTRISNAKMQEASKTPGEGAKSTVVVRKIIRNGQPDEDTKKSQEAKSETKPEVTPVSEKKVRQNSFGEE